MIEVLTTIDIRVPKWNLTDAEAVELMERMFPKGCTRISADNIDVGFKEVSVSTRGDYVIASFIKQRFADEKNWKEVDRYVEAAWKRLVDEYDSMTMNIKTFMKHHGGCSCIEMANIRDVVVLKLREPKNPTLTDHNDIEWGTLHWGPLKKDWIKEAIQDPTWQYTRKAMKGKSMKEKFNLCRDYLKVMAYNDFAKVAVTNYVNALKRAGLVFERRRI